MAFVSLKCPFCGDDDFDRIGLHLHLKNGRCEEFDKHEDDHPQCEEPREPLPFGCFSEDDLDLDGPGI